MRRPCSGSQAAGFADGCLLIPEAPGIGVELADDAEELEAKGVVFNPASAKYREDGSLKVIYLAEEIQGFAIHLTEG